MKPRSAIKTDLFADEHLSKKIDALVGSLIESESCIDFAALGAEVGCAVHRLVSPQWGFKPSCSRPCIFDGNVFVESLFKTAKYHLEFPVLGDCRDAWGLFRRAGKGELCDGDGGGLLRPELASLFPEGRNQSLVTPKTGQHR